MGSWHFEVPHIPSSVQKEGDFLSQPLLRLEAPWLPLLLPHQGKPPLSSSL